MPTFDLLTEPWIPVTRTDGAATQMGLRDVLDNAHLLREIRDPLPTVEFGLYRVLTAFVLDIFQPAETRALGELLKSGAFDRTKADAYFARWANRFDLFHPQYPFLQAAGMDSESAKPLAGLLHPIPSGTNACHFHHGHERDFGVSPAAAARLLTTIAPFMTAGGAGLSPSINGAPPWYALIAGRTVFETLCLNCCVVPLEQAREAGSPAWRDERPLETGRKTGASLLESLTWRPRRIQLIPGEPGRCGISCTAVSTLVSAMKFTAGASCDFTWQDPSVPYKNTKDGQLQIRPQEARDPWRDTGPLALLREGAHGSEETAIRFDRPRLIDQFAILVEDNILDRNAPLNLVMYGMRTDMKMKVFEWRRESLTLPVPLVLNRDFHGKIRTAMEQADTVAYYLKRAIKESYPRAGAGNKGACETLIGHTQRHYWAALRDEYDALLHGLAALSPEDDDREIQERCNAWAVTLGKAGRRILDEAIDDLDTDAKAMERQVGARRYFANQLRNVFATDEEKAARKKRPAKSTGATAQIDEGRNI